MAMASDAWSWSCWGESRRGKEMMLSGRKRRSSGGSGGRRDAIDEWNALVRCTDRAMFVVFLREAGTRNAILETTTRLRTGGAAKANRTSLLPYLQR